MNSAKKSRFYSGTFIVLVACAVLIGIWSVAPGGDVVGFMFGKYLPSNLQGSIDIWIQ